MAHPCVCKKRSRARKQVHLMTDPRTNGLAAKLPFLIILLTAAAGAFLLRNHLTFDALAENRDALVAFRDRNYALAVLIFMLTYIAIVGLSLPGATLIFLAAKHGFGARFAEKMTERGGNAARLQAALKENEWSALMIMRLAPVVPFFMANLIPAFVGARASRFIITTFFGVMPGTLILTSIGAGLDTVFAKGEMPDLSILFAPRILLPVLGLVALSALPIVIKYRRKKAP